MSGLKHTCLLLAFAVWEYWLGKTKKFVAASTGELILLGMRRLFERRSSMKVLASFAGGAVQLTEDKGVFSLSIDESVSLGGGQAAGVVKAAGKGSIQLDAELGLKLGEALLNSHLPAAVQPLAQAVEAIVNQAVKALE